MQTNQRMQLCVHYIISPPARILKKKKQFFHLYTLTVSGAKLNFYNYIILGISAAI